MTRTITLTADQFTTLQRALRAAEDHERDAADRNPAFAGYRIPRADRIRDLAAAIVDGQREPAAR